MIEISPNFFYLDVFEKIVFQNTKIKLNKEVEERVIESNCFLISYIKGKVVYGINTGLGPMAQYRIDEKHQVELQKNLIRSHAAGIGTHQPQMFVKGAMLSRLICFSKAHSGVSLETLEILIAFINNNIIPVVSKHGGVGASGDLVQLSQIALCLIGEGQVYYNDKIYQTKEILNKLNIKPLEIKHREGLALINGTSFMTSISCVNIIYAKKALNSAIIHGSLINELVESFDDHYSVELNQVKLHKHQQLVANQIRTILNDSKFIQKRADTYYNKQMSESVFEKKVQEYYSIRCLPQILGPISKAILDAEEVILEELNSVSDNPIIDVKAKAVFHGGNFHGDFVSAEMNKLKNSIIKLTVLIERQLNFLLNHKLNNVFPPFLNAGVLGLNLGLQGAQYAATSTTAENQTYSASNYIHSIPSNNDNQDVVSMGTNEALLTHVVIDNFFDVNSVLCLAIFQASKLKNNDNQFSSITKNYLKYFNPIIPFLKEDNELRPLLEKIKNCLVFDNSLNLH